MSAPQGPRSRSGSRGRGNARAAVRSRAAAHGGRERQVIKGPPTNATAIRPTSHQSKPSPDQSLHHNKSWRNPSSLSSAFQSHAGKMSNPSREKWRNPAVEDSRTYKQRMSDLYQTLKQNREQERKDAIKNGFLADPEKPTSLAHAITPVGTCQDMCPEFERVERIVQLMVDGSEKKSPSSESNVMLPSEEIMVKRFRRSAAGYDEQLPSDIRPPAVLQKTLNYLINDVVGGSEPLQKVHKFVWDRTRGIRNDFSIQQVTKIHDLSTAIDCFERIARFHILSLHQLSRSAGTGFDHHQEREQLNNTLLSLMYYYDDSRHKLVSPNEAEFRAYCIIFEIQDQRPDLEDRAQNWPRHILKDSRVQIALKLYAAAGNTSDEQGPLRPRTHFSVAQANTGGFWNLVQSNAISYTMACVAEIYFGLVRRTALQAISKAYRAKRPGQTRMDDWTLKDLTEALGLDDESQTQQYFKLNNVTVHKKKDDTEYIDIGSVMDDIDDDAWQSHKFSIRLVESKRLGRTLPAVVNGLSAAQAQSQGFIEVASGADTASVANSESLFVGESDDESVSSRSRSESPQETQHVNGQTPQLNPNATPFESKPTTTAPARANPFQAATTFGKPSGAPIQTNSTPVYDFNSKTTNRTTSNPLENKEPPKFNFFPPEKGSKAKESKDTPSVFSPKEPPKAPFPLSQLSSAAGENSNGPGPSSSAPPIDKKPTFGQPSTTFATTTSPGQTKTVAERPPTPTEAAVPSKPKSVFDFTAASSAPHTFSFGTSPLFGSTDTDSKPYDTKSNLLQSSERDHPTIRAPQQKDAAIKSFQTPSSSQSTSFSLFSTSSPATKETNVLQPASPKSTISTNSSNSLLPTSESQCNSRSSQPAPTFPSSTAPTFKPPLFPLSNKPVQATTQTPNSVLELNTPNSRAFSDPPVVKSSGSQSSQKKSTFTTSQLDPRSVALDQLSKSMLLEDNGVIQHFIEFTVGPIIKASIAQYNDDLSWKEARKCRAVLLAKKFLRRWKANAWNMGLMRRAKQRRRNLAESIQISAKSERQKQHDRQLSLSSLASSTGDSESPVELQRHTGNMMLPPLTPLKKRQSLPAGFDNEQSQLENITGTKRKREDSGTGVDQGTPRPTKIHHKRFRTIGDSIMSAPPHSMTRTAYRSRMDVSKVKDGSLLSEILMKQARRLAPNAKSDTTRTDYFQLKALGIDPDTPVVPLTKKRTRNEMEINGAGGSTGTASSSPRPSKSRRSSVSQPAAQPTPNSNKASESADDDEELFAQIRCVREALAESEQWCRSERQSLEKSMTPQPEEPAPNRETPAQRRLREIRERGPTPSRTEVRLRAMGDKALLPKGFWDGEGMGMSLAGKGKGKAKEAASSLVPSPQRESNPAAPRGFAALEKRGQTNGFGRGPFPPAIHQGRQAAEAEAEAQKQTGSSAEDAIEL